MKGLKEYITEAYDKKVERQIKKFIKDNYECADIFIDINNDGKYEVSCLGHVRVKNEDMESLTDGLFVWGKVKGNFGCGYCEKLKSLEGSPREVGGNFYCTGCKSLKTLDGCPEIVRGDFDCQDCKSLKSHNTEGIGGNFYM